MHISISDNSFCYSVDWEGTIRDQRDGHLLPTWETRMEFLAHCLGYRLGGWMGQQMGAVCVCCVFMHVKQDNLKLEEGSAVMTLLRMPHPILEYVYSNPSFTCGSNSLQIHNLKVIK